MIDLKAVEVEVKHLGDGFHYILEQLHKRGISNRSALVAMGEVVRSYIETYCDQFATHMFREGFDISTQMVVEAFMEGFNTKEGPKRKTND